MTKMTGNYMESRRRIVVVVSVIIVFFGVRVLYSFHRRSKLLFEEHEALKLGFQMCRNLSGVCDVDLKTCKGNDIKYKEVQDALNGQLEGKEKEVVAMQNTLESTKPQFSELQKTLESTKAELAKVQMAVEETNGKLSSAKQTNLNLIAAVNINVSSTDQLEVTPELEKSSITEIARMKDEINTLNVSKDSVATGSMAEIKRMKEVIKTLESRIQASVAATTKPDITTHQAEKPAMENTVAPEISVVN